MAKLRVNKIAAVGVSTENTGSVFFDGTEDYLTATGPGALGTGGDFTWEAWVYPVGDISSETGRVISANLSAHTGEGTMIRYRNGGWQFQVGDQASNIFTSPIPATGNSWYHVALTRTGAIDPAVFRGFVNGTMVWEQTDSSNTDVNITQFVIGWGLASQYARGYISNVRFINGTSLYTENFTPPIRELEIVDDTVLLACYDGENIFAEKTGNVIAAYGDRLSSPTPTATDSPIGITTFNPGLTRNVDQTAGPTFEGGVGYNSQNWLTLPKGTTTERFPDFGAVDAASARGVFAGGYSPGETNIIDYVTISTLGDAQDFGDLTVATEYAAGTSDRTRGLTLGGQTGSDALNTVSFVTIASTGNASDFGDLTNALRQKGALANSTRAIAVGGSPTSSPFAANNVMDYFTIQSSGNALNFGDLSELTNYGNPTASSVRGVFSGMSNPNGSVVTNTISYVTISTTGNAQNFGDLDFTGSGGGGLSNSTRGVIARDNNTELDFITIASLGNSQDFGTLTGNARYNTDAAVSSSTRGLFMIGAPAGNGINYITILSTGNAIDFGDLTRSPGGDAGFSNGHGGLG